MDNCENAPIQLIIESINPDDISAESDVVPTADVPVEDISTAEDVPVESDIPVEDISTSVDEIDVSDDAVSIFEVPTEFKQKNTSGVPKLIFIVPYRDRDEHRVFFLRYMSYILEDYHPSTYEIYFAHQCDTRPFNRGAMRNIGFLAMKEKYKLNDAYKNITFVFNDVDTVPYLKGLVTFDTSSNIVKHFYGYTHTLGGIVSMKGADFEKINGYPNLWAWGYEDNALYNRALKDKLIVDRSQFYKINDMRILHVIEGVFRSVNMDEKKRGNFGNKLDDGLLNIRRIDYVIDEINIYGFKAFTVDIYEFDTGIDPPQKYEEYNLLDPANYVTPRKMGMNLTTNNAFKPKYSEEDVKRILASTKPAQPVIASERKPIQRPAKVNNVKPVVVVQSNQPLIVGKSTHNLADNKYNPTGKPVAKNLSIGWKWNK